MVIGRRMLYPRGMGSRQCLANWITDVVTNLLFGGWRMATQSGLRTFSNWGAAQMQIITTGMEVSSKGIAEMVRNRLTWKSIPGKALY